MSCHLCNALIVVRLVHSHKRNGTNHGFSATVFSFSVFGSSQEFFGFISVRCVPGESWWLLFWAWAAAAFVLCCFSLASNRWIFSDGGQEEAAGRRALTKADWPHWFQVEARQGPAALNTHLPFQIGGLCSAGLARDLGRYRCRLFLYSLLMAADGNCNGLFRVCSAVISTRPWFRNVFLSFNQKRGGLECWCNGALVVTLSAHPGGYKRGKWRYSSWGGGIGPSVVTWPC